MNDIIVSALNKTWILDIDGTIVKHNGYLTDGRDLFLEGAETFLKNIPAGDMIIFLTSREDKYREMTESFLRHHGVRYDHIIFNAPNGERILMNDKKSSGLATAFAVNAERNKFCDVSFIMDETL